jgi:hypothetical protein
MADGVSLMLSVANQAFYAEFLYAECHYAECRYAECHYAECRGRGCLFSIVIMTFKLDFKNDRKKILRRF